MEAEGAQRRDEGVGLGLDKSGGEVDNLEEEITPLSFKGVFQLLFFMTLASLVACVALTLWRDFEAGTGTHCGVYNYLPSISAATGTFPLQSSIWKATVTLNSAPRLLLTFLSKKLLCSFTASNKGFARSLFIYLMAGAEVFEVLALMLLTLLPSSEAPAWHEKSFIIFVFCSQANMLLKIAILFSLRQDPKFTTKMKRSLCRKAKLWVLNVCGIAFGSYFFLRHNNYCEAGIYSLFAACEYALAVSNLCFHATSLHDLTAMEIFMRINYSQSDVGVYKETGI